MGREHTPKYRIEFHTTKPGYFTTQAWRVYGRFGRPGDGKPFTANIDRWVTAFENSLKPGGTNAHLGIFSIISAKIKKQDTGKVVAEWERHTARPDEPKFQAI